MPGAGAVGARRVRLASAPLSGVLHFPFAVGPAHSGASPEFPACSLPVSSHVTPGQTAAGMDTQLPCLLSSSSAPLAASYQTALALTEGNDGRWALGADPFPTPDTVSSKMTPKWGAGHKLSAQDTTLSRRGQPVGWALVPFIHFNVY